MIFRAIKLTAFVLIVWVVGEKIQISGKTLSHHAVARWNQLEKHPTSQQLLHNSGDLFQKGLESAKAFYKDRLVPAAQALMGKKAPASKQASPKPQRAFNDSDFYSA